MTAELNDIEHNKQVVELIGMLVYNKLLKVERKSNYTNPTYDELHIVLGSTDHLDMEILRHFYRLGYELRSVSNSFEIKYGCADSSSIDGGTTVVLVRSHSNVDVK